MKTKDEIIEKATFCFETSKAKACDETEEECANYYAGAWYALMWVLYEIYDI